MQAHPNSRILCSIRKLKDQRFTVLLICFGMLTVLTLMMRAPFTRAQTSESISTFASDCVTPQTVFNLGDEVCAVATNAAIADPAVGSFVQRRFEWVTPDGSLFQPIGPDIITATQSTSITLPTAGPLAQRGRWTVKTVDNSNNGQAVASFEVRDPQNAAVDLWCPISAPFTVSPGSSAPFTVFVTNKGPNDAQNVELTVSTATNSTFQSETQVSGPPFTCTNPDVGTTGSSTCTIATLPANTTVQLTFVFQVDSEAQAGTEVLSTASVTSDTDELFDADNTSSATVTIASPTCEISCPSDITDTTDTGQCGKVVSFGTPTGSGSGCGTIVCSPPSDSVFPIGKTNVVCFGDTGGPCSFIVTIEDPGATISCPANITQSEGSPGIGSAVVSFPAPTFPDSCSVPAAACSPPSGSSFPIGTTTVTCQTTNSSGSPLSCSFTVTVNSLVCLLNCIDDVFAVENPAGSNAAVVTFGSPTPSGCPSLTITCTPPSGSSFPVGSTTVNCSGKDASNNTLANCSFSVTVSPAAPCTLTCPLNVAVAEDGNPNLEPGAVVTYPAPASQNCSAVTITCSPASGTRFATGTTQVDCVATNASSVVVATCAFLVTVNSANPCTITCPANVTASNDAGQCGAVVNYPAPTTTGNCGSDPPACTPPSGSFFPTGATTVSCLVGGEVQCSFTVTVLQDGSSGAAKAWVGLKNSDDVGTKFDLLAEVFNNGELVALGQLNDVPGGSSGFNNAKLNTINLTPQGSVTFNPGDMLSFRLSVRIAASSGHVNGTARLWFNDSAANSRISSSVCSNGATSDHFLRDAFGLATSAGPGPKLKIDVSVNRNVGGNPFKPFGTWSKLF